MQLSHGPLPAFDRRIHIVIVSTPHGRVCATAVMTPVITSASFKGFGSEVKVQVRHAVCSRAVFWFTLVQGLVMHAQLCLS